MTSLDRFERDGVVVLRGLFTLAELDDCLEDWEFIKDAGRVVQWNPVAVEVGQNSAFHDLARHSTLTHEVLPLLDHQPVPYNVRLVVKDKHAKAGVFLHQDVGYHIGSLPKLSAFVALSSVIPENGGMRFWLGTHKYGYLGDVGEIDPKWLKEKVEIVCPVLAPGDVVLMHSATWHSSGENTCGVDRVMVDIIYQRADDPARMVPRDGLFVRSRSSRLKELQAQVDAK